MEPVPVGTPGLHPRPAPHRRHYTGFLLRDAAAGVVAAVVRLGDCVELARCPGEVRVRVCKQSATCVRTRPCLTSAHTLTPPPLPCTTGVPPPRAPDRAVGRAACRRAPAHVRVRHALLPPSRDHLRHGAVALRPPAALQQRPRGGGGTAGCGREDCGGAVRRRRRCTVPCCADAGRRGGWGWCACCCGVRVRVRVPLRPRGHGAGGRAAERGRAVVDRCRPNKTRLPAERTYPRVVDAGCLDGC
jgi:hypothetical protein